MTPMSICYNGFLGGPRSMGRVGHFLLTHLLSHTEYKVSFLPFKSDYMADRWERHFRDLIVQTPNQLAIDQLVTYCSVLDAQRPRQARRITPWLFYELSSLPATIVDKINCNDHVYICSNFVKQVFDEHGVTVPTSVLGHGFDPAHFRYTTREITGKFTFLCVAENTPRKNLRMLVRSFELAFQNQDNVRLVLKLGLHGEGDIRRHITQPDKIQLFTRSLAGDAQLAQLYRAANCFVLPTHSEGFGMPILEAMATGLPVIVTNHSGHLDFCSEANAYMIRSRGMIDSDPTCFPYINSQWADPDDDHLIHLMRHVHQNYDEALVVGLLAHQSVAQDWTWHAQLSKVF